MLKSGLKSEGVIIITETIQNDLQIPMHLRFLSYLQELILIVIVFVFLSFMTIKPTITTTIIPTVLLFIVLSFGLLLGKLKNNYSASVYGKGTEEEKHSLIEADASDMV